MDEQKNDKVQLLIEKHNNFLYYPLKEFGKEYQAYSYFARINELEKGDIITYQTKFYTRKYQVDNIQAIFETDWSLLENTTENKLSLITCIANKKNQRLCVQATEITENDL